jgi:hypothetical protein
VFNKTKRPVFLTGPADTDMKHALFQRHVMTNPVGHSIQEHLASAFSSRGLSYFIQWLRIVFRNATERNSVLTVWGIRYDPRLDPLSTAQLHAGGRMTFHPS